MSHILKWILKGLNSRRLKGQRIPYGDLNPSLQSVCITNQRMYSHYRSWFYNTTQIIRYSSDTTHLVAPTPLCMRSIQVFDRKTMDRSFLGQKRGPNISHFRKCGDYMSMPPKEKHKSHPVSDIRVAEEYQI